MKHSSHLLGKNSTTSSSLALAADDIHLQKLGYEPTLHRGLTAFSNFAVLNYRGNEIPQELS